MKKDIEFISYDGAYPNLCRGAFTVKIDGELVVFGVPSDILENWEKTKVYLKSAEYNDSFWVSGGECYFTNDYAEAHVESGEWLLNEDKLSDKYKEYAKELIECFNENVPYGCCGGCI